MSDTDPPALPLSLIGANAAPIWGMANAERARRMVAEALRGGTTVADGAVILANLAYVFDPMLLREAFKAPGTLFCWGDAPVVGQVPAGWSVTASATGVDAPGVTRIDLSDGRRLYNDKLRKLEQPFVRELTPDTRRGIERASYYGAYKGVTDLLTKYLWPEIALWLTRGAAQIGMTPNMVTAIGAALCLWATFLFAGGHYWAGVAAGFGFMVLDTVDGKLARCTITSSKWGNILDHGVDLIHPPFWWYAWGVGLAAHGLALPTATFAWVMGAVIVGYVLQRLIEGLFIKDFGMDIHVWGRFDSLFRLVTARRNPNMVILVASLLIGRPDWGLIALAWWTMISLIVHAVRLAQAYVVRAQGRPITSWMAAS